MKEHVNELTYEFVRSKMKELFEVEVEPFTISRDSAEKIKSILELEGNSKEELQQKRDSFVLLYSEEAKNFNYSQGLEVLDNLRYLTAVTHVIDIEYFNLIEEEEHQS